MALLQADLFRPHARHFFDAFFDRNNGIALLLSEPKEPGTQVKILQVCIKALPIC